MLPCSSWGVGLVGAPHHPPLLLHRKIPLPEWRPGHGPFCGSGKGGTPLMGCCSFLPAGSGALKIVGIASPFPPSQHVNTCRLLTKHLPLLQHPPKHQLWDGSTSFHQGWGWLPFSNVPLPCKRADDILLGFQRTGTYWKLQDSRCSALVVNSSRCYIGEMMYQSLGISPCCDIMMGHNSSGCASTCNLSCTSHPLRWDSGQLRPWGEDISQHVGDFGWELEV